MKAITREEMKKLDEWAIKEIGIPRLLLMENAGKAVAEAIREHIGTVKKVAVFCGKGNNGGDGAVAARHLKNSGTEVRIYLLGKKEEVTSEAKTNLEIAERMGISITELLSEEKFPDLKEVDVVIDAIFGIGFEGEITGLPAKVIDLINKSKKRTVAVDIPSGVDADTGRAGEQAVKADLTVTMAYPKIGLLSYPGSEYAGKLIIADIGIPKIEPKVEIIRPKEKRKIEGIEVTDIDYVSKYIPRRRVGAHKGECGKILILAGSPGMTGAAVLAARSALRSGAGLVYLGVPEGLRDSVDSMAEEVVTLGLPETKERTLSSDALKPIQERLKDCDVLAIGPGLSTQSGTVRLVKEIIRSKVTPVPIILDADGINSIMDDPGILKETHTKIIITPHPGEMSRLLKTSIEKVQADRVGSAKKAASEWKVITVLKGAYTVVTEPSGETFINPTGNPGMASAGVGDVLTGIMASFIGQGVPLFQAAVISVCLHGMAGDVVASLKGQHGLIASDIIEALPYVIDSVVKQRV